MEIRILMLCQYYTMVAQFYTSIEESPASSLANTHMRFSRTYVKWLLSCIKLHLWPENLMKKISTYNWWRLRNIVYLAFLNIWYLVRLYGGQSTQENPFASSARERNLLYKFSGERKIQGFGHLRVFSVTL